MTGEVLYFRADSGEPALPGCGRCKVPMVLATDPASPWVRLAELEAIVRDLAAEEPTVQNGDDFYPGPECGCCGAYTGGDLELTDHLPECEYRRARELMEGNQT